jgi:glycolate oxidase
VAERPDPDVTESRLDAATRQALETVLGPDRLLMQAADLASHAYDATFVTRRPAAVAMVRTTDEVSAVMRIATTADVPVVTRGAATSLSGGPVPAVPGALVLDLAQMDRILAVNVRDLTVTVEAGVVTGDLQRAVESRGLFYPPDPASLRTSTIGGNLATNAGGPRGLKYGVTRHHVLALEVVLADGTVLRTGSRAIKNATGYALSHLFVGSEGTLGVITRAVLKLVPKPPADRTLLAIFDRLEDAAALVEHVLTAGIVPAAIELMDQVCIRAVESHRPFGLPTDAEAVMIFRLDGHPAAVEAEQQMVSDLCRAAGARDVRAPSTAEDAEALWAARRAVSPSLARIRPNKLSEDISVPRSAIVPMVRRIGEIAERWQLPIPVFGHISDGNLHPNILFNLRDDDERERMLGAASELFLSALEFGGTLSGEHGVGHLKKSFLPFAVSPEALVAMRAIKALFDPKGLLNPHKVLPDGPGLVEPPVGRRPAPPNPFEGPFPDAFRARSQPYTGPMREDEVLE